MSEQSMLIFNILDLFHNFIEQKYEKLVGNHQPTSKISMLDMRLSPICLIRTGKGEVSPPKTTQNPTENHNFATYSNEQTYFDRKRPLLYYFRTAYRHSNNTRKSLANLPLSHSKRVLPSTPSDADSIPRSL